MKTRTLSLLSVLVGLCLAASTHAQTTNFYEGFEGGYGNWYVQGAAWEIGMPTSGPATNSLGLRAHSGTNLAATVLAGNYTDDTSGWLVSPSIVVPAAGQNPRLRFWHWWSFSCDDYGQVQISTNNGTSWIGLSPGYAADSSGQWTRTLLDLTPYAGQSVRLGFYFHSQSTFNCGSGVSSGWYVDDVVVESGALPVWTPGTTESFEDSGASDRWVADQSVWQVGVPTNPSGPATNAAGWRAHSGTNCLATVLAGNYTDDRSSRVMSPAFVVPAAGQNPRLRFWHWWSFSCDDYGQVQISTNNGTSWIPLSPGYAADSSGQWTRTLLDLTPYAGQSVRLGFYFHSQSTFNCGSGVSSGWYVDDVVVESGALPVWTPGTTESFEDSGASDRWVADQSVWQVGVPTNPSGPATNAAGWRAHSGTNCLATVLAGNYTDDRSSRVMSPSFVVPAAGQNPRLRFWHWWSFSCDDYGQVQISTNNGTSWVALPGGFSADSFGRWSRGWFDLTPYAGQSVRLGFYFHSQSTFNCGSGVSSGWYVDEVTIETGTVPGFNSPESFETGWGGWKVDYFGGKATDFAMWEIGMPTNPNGPPTNNLGLRAHSGTNCAATVLNGNYQDDREARLDSPPFVVPAAGQNPRLRFWHWWSFSCDDYGQVQISTNNGTSWIALSSQYTGTSSGVWAYPLFDLTPYAGQTVQLGLFFHSQSTFNCGSGVSAGWYVDEIVLQSDCTTPATPTAGNNGPVCAGSTLTLSTPTVASATYSWTGPNGFTSTLQNPTVSANATTGMSGTYSVTVTVNGCPSAPGTTVATVNAIPAMPTAGNNGPVCAGSALTLNTPTVASATYSWTGPNSFTSASQNPTVSAGATTGMSGTYSVTVTVNGCTSAAGSTVATVNAIPATPTAGNNGPVCAGSALSLSTPTVGGATYSWTGPNGFTSALQNPTVSASATTGMSGTYSVIVTVNGCASAAGSTVATVKATPATPTAGNNGPVCAGSTLQLTASTVPGATYSWTGPNGFSSAQQNPAISNATTLASGLYSVTASTNGCTSAAGTTTATVNAIPATPTAGNNGPVSAGSTLSLTASTVSSATYSWTGPNGFTSAVQNPTVSSNATLAMSGTYNVTATVNGCTSTAGSTVATVYNSVCSGSALRTAPLAYATGVVNHVAIVVTPSNTVQNYALEDVPPVGWIVTNIDNSGTFDAVNQKVKWGPFFDATARTLGYDVTPPAGTTGVWCFAGTAGFDYCTTSVTGSNCISQFVSWEHPADTNCDYRLTIAEITAYGACWRTPGCIWPTPSCALVTNPIPISFVTRAGYLWKNGEFYHYDGTQPFPLSWVLGASKLRMTLAVPETVSPSTATRTLPATYIPTFPVAVSNGVIPGVSVSSYAVEDAPPVGWTVANINNGGSWDSVALKVKWGPFLDHTARTLTYQATPPAGTTGVQTFAGTASFDGSNVAIGGAATINRLVTNLPPHIVTLPALTNGIAQLGNVAIVLAGTTNYFTATAIDPNGNPVTCLWSFGDGSTSTDCNPSHVYTNCQPFSVTFGATAGGLTNTSSTGVAVPCELDLTNRHTKLQANLNFRRLGADSCSLKAMFEGGTGFSPAGKSVTFDIGDAQVTFKLNRKARGTGRNGNCRLTYNRHTGIWTVIANLKKGSWRDEWAVYGLVETNTPPGGIEVTLPVIVLANDEAFMAEKQGLHYKAKVHKSGTAK